MNMCPQILPYHRDVGPASRPGVNAVGGHNECPAQLV